MNGTQKDNRSCPAYRRDGLPDYLGGGGRHWGLAWLRVRANGRDCCRGGRGNRRSYPNAPKIVSFWNSLESIGNLNQSVNRWCDRAGQKWQYLAIALNQLLPYPFQLKVFLGEVRDQRDISHRPTPGRSFVPTPVE